MYHLKRNRLDYQPLPRKRARDSRRDSIEPKNGRNSVSFIGLFLECTLKDTVRYFKQKLYLQIVVITPHPNKPTKRKQYNQWRHLRSLISRFIKSLILSNRRTISQGTEHYESIISDSSRFTLYYLTLVYLFVFSFPTFLLIPYLGLICLVPLQHYLLIF